MCKNLDGRFGKIRTGYRLNYKKISTKCEAHLTESIFQTRSRKETKDGLGFGRFYRRSKVSNDTI